MNRFGTVVFILGIVIAVGAGFVVFAILTFSQPPPAEVPTTKLVIAFQSINARSEIVKEQVGVADWPRTLPTPVGAYQEPSSVVGKLASAPLSPGQPVTEKVLIDKKDVLATHSNAAFLIENGSVGVAMPVNIESNVAQSVQAGDRVDVIATFRGAGGSTAVATQRLLSDMLILNVGNWPNPNDKSQAAGGTAVITLQLKEQDVLVLEYAKQFAADLTLVLRPANDREILTLEPVTFDYINQRFGFKLPR